MNESAHLWLIPLFPFLGFLLNGILGSRMPRRLVSAIGVLAPLISLVLVLSDFGATVISAASSCRGCGQVTALALPAVESLSYPWLVSTSPSSSIIFPRSCSS
jgi:NADH:ubiquinone oxidoreductase subunit 5 (subunit L)/multisubunit Na+/H+ antiporter MnhA subunit